MSQEDFFRYTAGQQVYQEGVPLQQFQQPPYFPLTHCPNCNLDLLQFLQSAPQSAMSQYEEQLPPNEPYGQTHGSSAQTPHYLLSSPERYPEYAGTQNGSTDRPRVEQVNEYGDMDLQQPINIASLPS